jgi:hypothetical protein
MLATRKVIFKDFGEASQAIHPIVNPGCYSTTVPSNTNSAKNLGHHSLDLNIEFTKASVGIKKYHVKIIIRYRRIKICL